MNIKRLLIIDRCLRDRSRQWSLDDLIEACSSTEKNSRRSVQADLELMRSAERGYSAPIVVVDKKYYNTLSIEGKQRYIEIYFYSEIALNIYVPNLMQKGAYAEFPVIIKNIGTLPAKLQSINQYSIGNTLIHVNYKGISVLDEVLYPNEERTFYVNVSLLRDVNVPNVKFDFQINFNYIQAK